MKIDGIYNITSFNSGDIVEWKNTIDFIELDWHKGFVLGGTWSPSRRGEEEKEEEGYRPYWPGVEKIKSSRGDNDYWIINIIEFFSCNQNSKRVTGIERHTAAFVPTKGFDQNFKCVGQWSENNGFTFPVPREDWIEDLKFKGSITNVSLTEDIINKKFVSEWKEKSYD